MDPAPGARRRGASQRAAHESAHAGPREAGPGGGTGTTDPDLVAPPPQYTLRDTPAIVERIEADLAKVVAAVRAADARLVSLVLTGGFARGEGTVLDGQPQNDYDFVAVRRFGRRPDYDAVRRRLEADLGLHVDLAPIPLWRLRRVQGSVFWYETALRGRVVWGAPVLGRIPVRHVRSLAPTEGLRLLSNRAAGLLLATAMPAPHDVRIQAAKAILGASDAELLARGVFPPSQRERWATWQALAATQAVPPWMAREAAWVDWAFRFKTDPGAAPARDAVAAWDAARAAVLAAVPAALGAAELAHLDAYARRDSWAERAVFAARAGSVPGARRLSRHATGRLRVATLRILQASQGQRLDAALARSELAPLADTDGRDPLAVLQALRGAAAV